MSVLTVAKEKSGKPKAKDASEYTTFRLFAQDGEELSDLADEEKKTIAEMYRELCAPLVKARLIKRTEEKLRKMKGE